MKMLRSYIYDTFSIAFFPDPRDANVTSVSVGPGRFRTLRKGRRQNSTAEVANLPLKLMTSGN